MNRIFGHRGRNRCPKCRSRIEVSVFDVDFRCVRCRTELSATWLGSLFLFAVVWTALIIGIFQLFDEALFNAPDLRAFLILLLGIVGLAAYLCLFPFICGVKEGR